MTGPQLVDIDDRLFDDPRFESDKCGPIGGYALLRLLSKTAQTGASVFGLSVALETVQVPEARKVIDSLIQHGFLVRNGDFISLADTDLWRL